MVNPNQAIANPIAKITIVRRMIFHATAPDSRKSNFLNDIYVDIPMMNMKNGKTRSVGVRPIHSAWPSGA